MEGYMERGEEQTANLATKTSFFTRRLTGKLQQRGVDVPNSVVAFLDTPLCTLNEQQSVYFEQKFCPLIPNIVSALEEIFNEMGADPEGWEDMMVYAGNLDTPIKICANAVLIKKEKEAADVVSLERKKQQMTKKISLPSWIGQLSSSTG
ncbi:MAG: hypothetical protein AB1384_12715 [Actinomycetota bacterium]